jgi:hypothetical protein
MSLSKQFSQNSTPKHIHAKVWGNQTRRKVADLDRSNPSYRASGFKSFTTDKTTISKIFAPKLTVINNNIQIGQSQQSEIDTPNNTSSPESSSYNYHAAQPEAIFAKLNNQSTPSSNKAENFWEAILPKISFGKFSFGKAGLQTKSSDKIVNKNHPVDFQASAPFQAEATAATSSQSNGQSHPQSINSQYDPEAIFQKIKAGKKTEPNLNLFSYLKNSSMEASGNWWDSIKFGYYDKAWFRKLNYQLVAFDVAKNFNRLVVGLLALSLIGFFSYLAFFDQFFTIKKYNVEFLSGSYLNNQQTYELIGHLQKNKLYKVFPNNQYWFANSLSLSASAKEIFPEIQSVNVKTRQWPSQISLQVETNKPILTLWVNENNQQKYWRVNETGKILAQDKAALWYNLVKVEKPYSIADSSTAQLSLFNHSFEADSLQKQRFVLTKQLLDYFKGVNIQINQTSFPSISDTDIIMESATGTKFIFDSMGFEPGMQLQRLDYFLKSKPEQSDYYQLHSKGDYAYFDFRIAKKVHTCKVSAKCNIKPE